MMAVRKDTQNRHTFNQNHQERESTQINKIRHERGEVNIDATEKQKIVKNYYEQINSKTLDNLGEMDKSHKTE